MSASAAAVYRRAMAAALWSPHHGRRTMAAAPAGAHLMFSQGADEVPGALAFGALLAAVETNTRVREARRG